MPSKSAYIIVGFTEGNWHVKRFERGLKRHGYSITKDVTEAHYVIAHSGGCYTIPPLHDKQVLLLINPTYWPGRTLAERGLATIRQIITAIRPGNKPFHHINKTLHNIFYLFYNHRINWFMAQQAKIYRLERSINHGKTILVRNDNDTWLTPQLDGLQKLHPRLQIVRLPGGHDDCWLHPKPYIELLDNA